jgi:hypothetical protein
MDQNRMLDDQATAKKYEGQGIVVTGTLNATHNTIYVRKIEAVCELPVYRLSGFNTTRHSDGRPNHSAATTTRVAAGRSALS